MKPRIGVTISTGGVVLEVGEAPIADPHVPYIKLTVGYKADPVSLTKYELEALREIIRVLDKTGLASP